MTVYKKPFFDAVIYIDMYDENWIRKFNITQSRECYGRMLDFIDMLDIGSVFFHYTEGEFNIHPMLLNFYDKEIPNVNTLDELEILLPKGSKILVAGQSWWACTHHTPLGIPKLLEAGYNVYSHPNIIIASREFSPEQKFSFKRKLKPKDFLHDPLVKWKKESFKFQQAVKLIKDTNND